ncbi:protransforming growth factor alpha isoform X2 [Cynoglossus semilaevis]|uniref:protransforming growth factor alpha isoform X2 n=1 Tax=Cynoglossus semilaevis TaxID=244447 RepID=UPI0004951651|nr:uncharacterized protein LOC103385772 isoform X2 [Cynoglossus semilaevis]
MTRIFWDTVLLISGSLFTFGAGPSNSTIQAPVSFDTNSSVASNTSLSSSANASSSANTHEAHQVRSLIFTFEAGKRNESLFDAGRPVHPNDAVPQNISAPTGSNSRTTTTTTTSAAATTTSSLQVKKFVIAAVRSHFDECPDSHRHFCFHGTCRFLILEETPACVCHPGFMGMRCEHADLLAVVATNHRPHNVATALVLCVIGCWWQQDCRRRRYTQRYVQEKHATSCYPPESVV